MRLMVEAPAPRVVLATVWATAPVDPINVSAPPPMEAATICGAVGEVFCRGEVPPKTKAVVEGSRFVAVAPEAPKLRRSSLIEFTEVAEGPGAPVPMVVAPV